MAKIESWQEIFSRARRALKAGNKNEARRLARKVVGLAPDKEASWLLLAATSGPKASIGYLKQALTINPNSKRAKQGLRWAAKRAKLQQSASKELRLQSEARLIPKSRNLLTLTAVSLTIAFALFAWFRPSGLDQGLRSVSAAAANQVSALISSPTAIVINTATFTSTSTSTSTPSPSPSPTPSHTPTAEASLTPTEAVSAVPTNGPEAKEALAKFRVSIPASIDENEGWIDLNLSTQVLTAYNGNEAIRTFVISSGRAGTPTVVGEFPIWIKVRIQDMSGPGYYLTDVPYVMYFFEDYGIHGTYWHNNFGTPMSAGCVNMTIDDSYWMFQFASVGTIVNVHY